MHKFLKRFFLFLAVVSAIAAGVYYFTQFYKQYSKSQQDLPHDMKNKHYHPDPPKRHYTKLTRVAE